MLFYASAPKELECRFRNHTHKHYEIMIVIEGNGFFASGSRKWPFSPGSIFIAPPEMDHSTYSDDGYNIISIGGKFDNLFAMDDICAIEDNEYGEGVMLAKAILRNVHSNKDYATALCRAFVKYLLMGVERPPFICSVVYKITSEIEKQFDDPDFKVTKLLEESGYSEDYIRMKFHEVMGMTPVRYLNEIRMRNAKDLITLYDFSISEVAFKCGVLDNAHFSRLFKSHFGMSPNQYRSSLKQK